MMKNPTIKFLLFIVAVLIIKNSFSQENYLPGYVINSNGDTLTGFIDYRNWETNPNAVNFKSAINDKPIALNPTNTLEFSVKDEKYISATVNFENSPTNSEVLNDNPTLHFIENTVFLQTIFKGNKSLYYYNFEGRDNFYIKQDANYELLVYKKYFTKREGKSIIAENKKFIGQLTLYLSDCSNIQTKLKTTSYNQNSLKKIFKYYAECTSSEVVFQREKEKVLPEFGLFLGASLSSLKFKSNEISYLEYIHFNQSINFTTGLFCDFVLPRNQKKWSINNELVFTSYEINGNLKAYENGNNYENDDVTLGYSYIKMNNMLRYKYPVGKFFVYLNGGVSNGFVITETNYLKTETKFRTTESEALSNTRKYEQGLIIGTGLKFNKFSFEFRYERGNGMAVYELLKSITQRYYFLFAYKF